MTQQPTGRQSDRLLCQPDIRMAGEFLHLDILGISKQNVKKNRLSRRETFLFSSQPM